ncbi:MAG: PAS domain-containing protein [Anaerolinea sp.]|nr:PAS domain-containing protein [Anaerolinea sp.]
MANMGVPVGLRRPLSERASLETTLAQGQRFTQFSALCQVLDAIPNAIAILNAQRQVIYANRAFSDYVSVADATAVIGLRVGEAINCLHATDASTGCGTSNFCSTCGALHAILQAQQGKKSVQECRITRSLSNELEAVDLRVWATPFEMEDDLFTIFAAVDIADEKRRHVLEVLPQFV